MLTQFVAAFDDIVIGRFNKAREEKDKINVRYVYAPKQRVLQDLVNLNKTMTLPAVSINVTNVSRDESRVFNKIDGFYYTGATEQEDLVSRHLKSPVPVNISISCSILTRYQTDMDQILSNFVPFCNPYVVVSWKVPEKFNLAKDQEIRSEVLWNGDVSLDYPVETTGTQKARVTADTSFTIKGWLFKDTDSDVGNVFKIDADFYNENLLTTYDNYESLSGNTYTYPTSTGLINETKSVTVSGAPELTNIFYNGVQLLDTFKVPGVLNSSDGTGSNVMLQGTRLDKINGLLLSSNTFSYFDTSVIPLCTYSSFVSGVHGIGKTITGHDISYTTISDNTITFSLSSPTTLQNHAPSIQFVPYTLSAGYAISSKTTTSRTYSGNNTFIIVGG